MLDFTELDKATLEFCRHCLERALEEPPSYMCDDWEIPSVIIYGDDNAASR